MQDQYPSLSHVRLKPATTYERPPELPHHVRMGSPALQVMTDFSYVRPRTVKPDVSIDRALQYMKASGVRLLLVTDDQDQIVGIITSYDIQGERPIQLAQASRVARAEITVGQIMTPQPDIEVVHLLSVRNVQVGNIVASLRMLDLRHMLVIESDDLLESAAEEMAVTRSLESLPAPGHTGHEWVRGLFSATQISRQLGVDIDEVMTPAHSLAEIVHERA